MDKMFRVIKIKDGYQVLYDNGSVTFEEKTPVRQLFNMWLKEN